MTVYGIFIGVFLVLYFSHCWFETIHKFNVTKGNFSLIYLFIDSPRRPIRVNNVKMQIEIELRPNTNFCQAMIYDVHELELGNNRLWSNQIAAKFWTNYHEFGHSV